jgi:ribosomal protein S18 acetylase RimI-like enzyme
MTTTELPPCDLLEWDTQFFGFAIATVIDPLLTPQRCASIDAWCRANRVKCLYFRASAEPATTALAEQNGFRLVDVRTTLSRKLEDSFRPRTIASRIRRASEADLPRLEAIAAESHRNTRFFYDGRFPAERCAEMYRTWIRNQVKSDDCDVAVAESGGTLAGYSTSGVSDRGAGVISLMAVAPEFRHRGIGDDLVQASLMYQSAQRATSVRVTTQGWNVAALRLYQRCGFRTSIVDLFFHKWYD